ncbi:hypothetical protein CEXT_363651 [Caerostris extrusa]|uniref:Uncharacterized protein n=1 Tax=Caerostris extrusa TaxID=172846 RepID=A0AAV4XIG5_CAEEX|nr:hypothetical protein CEXT_363651 [Caerostris extrusa]
MDPTFAELGDMNIAYAVAECNEPAIYLQQYIRRDVLSVIASLNTSTLLLLFQLDDKPHSLYYISCPTASELHSEKHCAPITHAPVRPASVAAAGNDGVTTAKNKPKQKFQLFCHRATIAGKFKRKVANLSNPWKMLWNISV